MNIIIRGDILKKSWPLAKKAVLAFLESKATSSGDVRAEIKSACRWFGFRSTSDFHRLALELEHDGFLGGYEGGAEVVTAKLPQVKVMNFDLGLTDQDPVNELVLIWSTAGLSSERIAAIKGIRLSRDLTAKAATCLKSREFRRVWKKALRVMMADPGLERRRFGISKFLSRVKGGELFVSSVVRCFEENPPPVSEIQHLVIYPEPKDQHGQSWRCYPGMTGKQWSDLMPTKREELYELLSAALPSPL